MADQPFCIEVVGDRGSLVLDGGGPRGPQASRLGLLHDRVRQPVYDGALATVSDAAINVAGVYSALRNDIVSGSATVTDFDHAERLTRFVEAVFEASEQRGRIGDNGAWPLR